MDSFFDLFSVTGILMTAASAGFVYFFFTRRRLPPGPLGVPILGSLPFWKGPETNMEWYKKYGDIYSVKMGPNLVVYLNTVALVNKHLKRSDIFVDRPPGPAAIGEGVLFGSGDKWHVNRDVCLQRMWKENSLQTYEEYFQNEAADMMAEIEKYSGNEFNLTNVLRLSVVNCLTSLIKGTRFQHDDPEFVKLIGVIRQMDKIDLFTISSMIPLIPHDSTDLRHVTTSLATIIRKWIKERQDSIADANSSKDLIGLFLNSTEFHHRISADQEMVQSTMDIFNSGVISTLSGLEFLFLYLIHHPEVQTRIQTEIDDVIGSDGKPSWEHFSKLTYTIATIFETLRLGSVSPATLPHVATEDATIEGYDIPKGTFVVSSLFCLHRQSDVFDDPECFKPERHLDENGGLKSYENMMPFGVEPRYCIGDKWFYVYAFLTVTFILQRYNVSHPSGNQLPPFVTKMGVVRRLEPFNLVLTPRQRR